MDDIQFVIPPPSQKPGKLIPRFYTEPKQDQELTAKEGRPIFKDVEYVEIRIPGVVKDIFVERVTQKVINEYPEEYRHWKATQTQMVAGTPLAQYPKMTRSRAMELRVAGILTCEQFIALTDQQMQNLGPVRKEIAEIKAWMDAAKDSALVMKQAAELEKRDEEINILKRQIAELAERFGNLEDKQPRRRTNTQ